MGEILWDVFTSTNKTTSKNDYIAEIQDNMNEKLEDYITSYEVKLGMDFYKNKAILNGELEFDCVVNRESVKDKTLNSLSRRIRYGSHVPIKAGDYVRYRDNYAEYETERNYIIIAQPNPLRGYYESYMTECCFSFNMRDEEGNIMTVPCYPDDNKIMIKDSNIGTMSSLDASTTWILVQDNKHTRRFGKDLKRIIIDDWCYDVVGINRLPSVKGITRISIKNGSTHPNDDLVNGVAYNNSETVVANTSSDELLEIVGNTDLSFGIANTYEFANYSGYNTLWQCDSPSIVFEMADKNNCKIRCDYNKEMHYENIILKAIVGNVEYEKVITVVD